MSELIRKIEAREATVAVIGLGYVGLPVCRIFGAAGFRVLGFDTDPSKIAALLQGRSYIRHIPAADTTKLVATGRLTPTHDLSRLAEADCIVICVPTPLTADQQPDLSFVRSTAQAIGASLRPGQLISLESTTFPGTTAEVLLPALQSAAPGLEVGKDFYLAYSPEREDPGNTSFETQAIPKLVGGLTPACQTRAITFYSAAFQQVVPVSSPAVGELSKLLENIYRAVNIAMVNELKLLCHRMDLDIHEVINAAATKPFGYQPFYPGPGVGGHCIPVDPLYLESKAREYGFQTRFIELANQINRQMPEYVVERVKQALERRGKLLAGSDVLVLGVAYKKNIDDVRESPAHRIIELLENHGAGVGYNDPYVPVTQRRCGRPMTSEAATPERLAKADGVVIVTDHGSYDYATIVEHAQLVVDTRNATAGVIEGREKIVLA